MGVRITVDVQLGVLGCIRKLAEVTGRDYRDILHDALQYGVQRLCDDWNYHDES
jgi:hypothetical protein